MAAGVIQGENLSDLVSNTLKQLGKPKFTEITTDVQQHYAMRNLMLQRQVEPSGVGIQWNVLVDHNHAAANVGLYAQDNVNVMDGMVQASVNWRNTTTNYAIDGRELAMNREPSRIVDQIHERRIQGLISLVELMEQNFWGLPAATDPVTPLGLPFWITKNATEGFNGGTATGYSTVAGLNTTTYPRWNNWTYQYVTVSKDDFIRHVRQAAAKTDFKPPVDGIPSFNTGDKYGFYTNYSVLGQLEEALEAQNENLGTDVASMDGKTLFRRINVNWVPWLDRDTTNPFYGINWGDFKTHMMKDWWLKETHIPITAGQHTVMSQHIDCMYQYVARNRRRHFVASTGTTYPA